MQTPFKKFRKILTAMLKIAYAPCGYANVLSFSLAHWARGWQGYFFVWVLRIIMTLKIIILAYSLSSIHTHDLLPLTGKKIFLCSQNVSNVISSSTALCYHWKVPPPQPHKLKSSLLQLQSSRGNTLPFSCSWASLLIWLLLRTIKLLTSPSKWPSVAVPAVPTSWPWHHSAAFKPLKS